ncbi:MULTISPECIES: hypothetical protein [unclassified Bradyrhizobium]|uniref:hypothetical protein n=1 Tax=unclassified Bradyrhizobium TaxID=2631580 RepID=UPI0024798429|nr:MULTISPECIES: hypothetical protein [unclassified Bradyrhizobium]WGS23375.1 hypothetical protein MTX22_18170 [Bradyrhizobium sp. ISRA463]WGS30388.1 hypothetical protein MTX19_15895 [Bradyrhizobium sp. ISRA464]
MPDHVIKVIDPKTGELRHVTLSLTDKQFLDAKRSNLRDLTPKMRAAIPAGFMPAGESFATP